MAKETLREREKREQYAAFLASRGREAPAAPQAAPSRRASAPGMLLPGLEAPVEGGPVLHNCACGKWGMFGMGETWFCQSHLPADYWGWDRG